MLYVGGGTLDASEELRELVKLTGLGINAICGRVNREGDVLESGNFLVPGDTRRAQVVAPSDPAPDKVAIAISRSAQPSSKARRVAQRVPLRQVATRPPSLFQ